MILIAHRGNINGPNPLEENKPEYINNALALGFHVEIDVWLDPSGSLFLGHDEPQYETSLDFLKHDDRIICHAKTVPTFQFLVANNLHCFFHDKDPATLTSHNKIWLYPGVPPCPNMTGTERYLILVMPEWPTIDYKGEKWIDFVVKSADLCYGICSDNVKLIKKAMAGKIQ